MGPLLWRHCWKTRSWIECVTREVWLIIHKPLYQIRPKPSQQQPTVAWHTQSYNINVRLRVKWQFLKVLYDNVCAQGGTCVVCWLRPAHWHKHGNPTTDTIIVITIMKTWRSTSTCVTWQLVSTTCLKLTSRWTTWVLDGSGIMQGCMCSNKLRKQWTNSNNRSFTSVVII